MYKIHWHDMSIEMTGYPTEDDWIEVKRRCAVTTGKTVVKPADTFTKRKALMSRHTPIRYLRYSFALKNIPYWVAMHLRTHVHDCANGDEFAEYVLSQRNDRQSKYDRGKAPQDAPVNLTLDISADQLQSIALKRLCAGTAAETRHVVRGMCYLAQQVTPEFRGLLAPMCERYGKCEEWHPCGKLPQEKWRLEDGNVQELVGWICEGCDAGVSTEADQGEHEEVQRGV